ncbi:enoyl-CoA hydratase-related protein [Mycobacterium paraffinicum]|uniref:enoyl-CoA hydratase-related protein n=1 Tax=Mycobacterium paraffinicum TaxID=53378 RepID=UPI00142D9F0D|nr:enoyl-CoA hydratase-related protein [Mycobacterium paraffinicum]
MTDAAETILTDVRDGVATITLNRPHRRNAFTPPMRERYNAELAAAADDDAVRVIVVTGAGDAFCAGADTAQLDGIAGGTAQPDFNSSTPARLIGIGKPVIAAVNGPAAGAGAVEAMGCDIRFAGPGTKFRFLFTQLGLVAENGVAWLLSRSVGTHRALDLLLSGRTVDGREAGRIGLAEYTDGDVLEAAQRYATGIAERCAPNAVATVKSQVYASLQRTLADDIAASNELVVAALAGDEFRTALTKGRR